MELCTIRQTPGFKIDSINDSTSCIVLFNSISAVLEGIR